jgi:YVTN family beta-propeller protein
MALVLALSVATAAQAQPDAQPRYHSPTAIAADPTGGTLYVVESTHRSIAVVDVSGKKVAGRFDVPGDPTGVAVSADGKVVHVTIGGPDGRLLDIDAKSGAILSEVSLGHTPMSPVLSPDGKAIYVCNRFNNAVGVVDRAAGREVARIELIREPVSAALTPDGKTLVVGNHLPLHPADGDYVGCTVSIIDTAARSVAAQIELPNGATSVRTVALSPDGRFAYVTHILARYQLPTTQLERGWMNTNAVSVIDVSGRKLVNTVLLDDVTLGAANPWGAGVTGDGKWLVISHAGTHELSMIDRAAMHERLDRAARNERVNEVTGTAADVSGDLSFLSGKRRRIALTGNGPRGICIVGTVVYAAQYFSDDLASVDLSAGSPQAVALALGPGVSETVERAGERMFHDAALCFQQWQSCTSCHPDSRVDALNWDLLNDGFGNPKNTRSMLWTFETPPVMSLAVRDDASVAVRAGLRYIQFTNRPDEDVNAIGAYLKSLKPVPSPYLVKGQLSDSAQRGAIVFQKAGCASCHPAPLYTNLKSFNVGPVAGLDAGKAIDTPTLVEVWRTAPYLHSGAATTVREVLTTFNTDGRHGHVGKLTPEQMDDLIEFVLSQ